MTLKMNTSQLEASETASNQLAMGMIFMLQTLVGILGNVSLLCHYISLSLTRHRLKATDLILKHLTVANSLVILSKGIPQTMLGLGWKDFLSDLGCKLVFYVHRVGRGVSMATTCLLSVFQMLTICPGDPRQAELRKRASRYMESCMLLTWMLNMLLNFSLSMRLTDKASQRNITKQKDFGYCSAPFQSELQASLFIALLFVADVFCLEVMIWASGSMVSILFRHKLQVQYLHRMHLTSRSSPETRATQNILVLLSTFVSFYTLSSIGHLYIAFANNPNWLLVNISALFSACFPTVCPFVLKSHLCLGSAVNR